MASTSSRVRAFLDRARNVQTSRNSETTTTTAVSAVSPKPRRSSPAKQSTSPVRTQASKKTQPGPNPKDTVARIRAQLTDKRPQSKSPMGRVSLPSPAKPPMPIIRGSPKGRTSLSPIARFSPKNVQLNRGSPRQPLSNRSSRSSSPATFIMDTNLLSEIETLVSYLQFERKSQKPKEELQALAKVKSSIRNHKAKGTKSPERSVSPGFKKPSTDYKQKAKKLLLLVKEETMEMDRKLETLKAENQILRDQLETKSLKKQPDLPTGPFKITQIPEQQQYENQLDRELLHLYTTPATATNYEALAKTMGKRLIHEQQQRLHVEELAAKQIYEQEETINGIEERIRKLEQMNTSPLKMSGEMSPAITISRGDSMGEAGQIAAEAGQVFADVAPIAKKPPVSAMSIIPLQDQLDIDEVNVPGLPISQMPKKIPDVTPPSSECRRVAQKLLQEIFERVVAGLD